MHHPNFSLIRHDVIQPILLEVDQIYHLACPASPPHYQYNPVKTIKTSTMGRLLDNSCTQRICHAYASVLITCSFLFAVEHTNRDYQYVGIGKTCQGAYLVSINQWNLRRSRSSSTARGECIFSSTFCLLQCIRVSKTDMIIHHTINLWRHTGEMSTHWVQDHVTMRENVWLKLWCTHTRIRTMCQFVLHGFLIPLGHVCTRMMVVLWGKNYNA